MNIWWSGNGCPIYFNPVDTGRKLNVHKTFRRRPGRLLNVLCTFNLRPVFTGKKWHTLQKVYFCGRKTCPNSLVLCYRRYTAITEFSYLHLHIPFCMNPTFLQLYSMHFCWRRVPYTTFCFCRKDKDNSLFVLLIFLSLEFKGTSCQTFFLKFRFFFKLNPSLNFLHIKFSLCFVFVLLYFSVCNFQSMKTPVGLNSLL